MDEKACSVNCHGQQPLGLPHGCDHVDTALFNSTALLLISRGLLSEVSLAALANSSLYRVNDFPNTSY